MWTSASSTPALSIYSSNSQLYKSWAIDIESFCISNIDSSVYRPILTRLTYFLAIEMSISIDWNTIQYRYTGADHLQKQEAINGIKVK